MSKLSNNNKVNCVDYWSYINGYSCEERFNEKNGQEYKTRSEVQAFDKFLEKNLAYDKQMGLFSWIDTMCRKQGDVGFSDAGRMFIRDRMYEDECVLDVLMKYGMNSGRHYDAVSINSNHSVDALVVDSAFPNSKVIMLNNTLTYGIYGMYSALYIMKAIADSYNVQNCYWLLPISDGGHWFGLLAKYNFQAKKIECKIVDSGGINSTHSQPTFNNILKVMFPAMNISWVNNLNGQFYFYPHSNNSCGVHLSVMLAVNSALISPNPQYADAAYLRGVQVDLSNTVAQDYQNVLLTRVIKAHCGQKMTNFSLSSITAEKIVAQNLVEISVDESQPIALQEQGFHELGGVFGQPTFSPPKQKPAYVVRVYKTPQTVNTTANEECKDDVQNDNSDYQIQLSKIVSLIDNDLVNEGNKQTLVDFINQYHARSDFVVVRNLLESKSVNSLMKELYNQANGIKDQQISSEVVQEAVKVSDSAYDQRYLTNLERMKKVLQEPNIDNANKARMLVFIDNYKEKLVCDQEFCDTLSAKNDSSWEMVRTALSGDVDGDAQP